MFEFSKKSVTGDDELEGAKLSVIDENNKVVDTWTSTKKTHKIEGLVVGKTYKLKEEIAPDGYVRASTIEFKVESTTKVQQVKMIDKIVTMTKADIGGKEIEGAEIVVTDKDGNAISWASSGAIGFKGSKKSTPFAAGQAAEKAGKMAYDAGMRKVEVVVKGVGPGRETAIRSLQTAGLEVTMISDVTPIPHNGCRPPKRPRN